MTAEDGVSLTSNVISLHARISENTSRDLRGVETLTALAADRFCVDPFVVEGRTVPFGRTSWEDDLAASRDVLALAAHCLREVMEVSSVPPLTLATDCALALATLPAVTRLHPGARVLWLDAHCDFDTPDTTTIGFLGCMSLAGACGRWESGFAPPIPERQVVLVGTRPEPDDFDIAAQRAVERSDVTLIDISESVIEEVVEALRGTQVYIHFDPDVLDPSVFPTPYARANGLSAAAARSLLQTVAEHNSILGVEITAFHAPDDPAARHELAGWLLDVVAPLLTPGTQPAVL